MARKPQRAAMPKWRRAPDALIQQFGRAVEGLPGVESRKMFGYPAVFVNGNMFAGLFHDSMILRLNAEDRDTFPGAAPFEPMPGRPMREYVVAPASVLDSMTLLHTWLERARSFAASLPPKQSARKATKAATARKAKPKP